MSLTGGFTFSIILGLSYSFSIMLILLGHEMGHYLMSQKYRIRATLPYFLPFPHIYIPFLGWLPSPFGTLGAVIRMESSVSSRKALFDTGVAGPLTSFILSIPAIVIGLKFSTVIPISHIKGGGIRLADPLIFSFIQKLVMQDIPSNCEVVLHPIAYAGWVGLFVTSLNLLPIGQLDGGHVVYGLFGKRSRVIFLIAIVVMAFITVFYNPGWFLLLILIILFGFRHPAPLDDETPLGWKRKLLGGVVFLAFFLSFTPTPFPDYVGDLKEIFR
ncbi:MAG TPA: site-2 protease family protein [Thermodesulfobacteriota bacterium]|nr:site-2 protease family protein [Thermodesulfobacteriota bacterium]